MVINDYHILDLDQKRNLFYELVVFLYDQLFPGLLICGVIIQWQEAQQE